MKKRIAVLGATGSIGKSSLDVLSKDRDAFDVVLLSAHNDKTKLREIYDSWPQAVCVLSGEVDGKEKLLAAIGQVRADTVINGIAGSAGLEPSLAAIEAGSALALANKETIVMAGSLVSRLASEKKSKIIPVDSEHSAIFRMIEAHGRQNTDEIILTASGGPFRNKTLKEMENITVEAALAHPTWKMGKKISIDSASMANKGLEIIEAAYLFNMPPEKVRVTIHPQSIVHSMLKLHSGAIYAQLSMPDMRQPIHDALYWPDIKQGNFPPLSFDSLSLEFEKPDINKFPMLGFAWEAAKLGGLYTCAYNSANEIAVAAFFENRISFLEIPVIVRYVLDRGWAAECGDIRTVLKADEDARSMAVSYINR
ncbi:MAG: 1-deoxy-D-xylulose-5-phosphate reductoisomerase [Treponema sp.]|nr:1-deoxy-D-xylulose-5-phosphate reductoisomerase [Treponema sp.]